MGKCTDDMINIEVAEINTKRLGKLNCFIKWLKDKGVISMDDISNSFKMKLGFRLSDLRVGKSWIGRQIFFLLSQIEDTGGGLQRRNFSLLHPYQK